MRRTLANRLSDRVLRAPPLTRQGLLEIYATSDLAAAGYPSWLAVWRGNEPLTSLATAQLNVPLDSLRRVVERARAEGRPLSADLPGVPALEHAIAVPTDSGVVTLVVAPQSRLIPPDPFARLLGIETPPEAEPPYTVQLAPLSRGAPASTRPQWRREGTELHGDWTAATGRGAARVHAEVELRPLFALTQRGTLIALLNLAIVALLWLTSVLADGSAARWVAVRRRRWSRSYRIRLTLALFAFFMVPAVAFAIWSYQQLSTDAARARQLLVRETLRAVTPDTGATEWLARESRRLQSPLFLYRRGELVAASDSLLEDVAPIGRLLGPEIGLAVLVRGEVGAHRVERVGRARTLFGYRVLESEGETVIAAPARADELALGRRARDLGVLVLFATAIGALAALWLSGIAARQLARPIGIAPPRGARLRRRRTGATARRTADGRIPPRIRRVPAHDAGSELEPVRARRSDSADRDGASQRRERGDRARRSRHRHAGQSARGRIARRAVAAGHTPGGRRSARARVDGSELPGWRQ